MPPSGTLRETASPTSYAGMGEERINLRSPRPTQTLLEAGLPISELSQIARADKFSRDPVYSVHRWWARRPPSTCRALLLAAFMPVQTRSDEFWEAYGAQQMPLRDRRVGDPFLGGATTLVEARRLGADVVGLDIDPLATLIASHELEGMDVADFSEHARQLTAFLNEKCSCYYPSLDRATPLHYFFLRRIVCPSCQNSEYLYKSLLLARDIGRPGAVVRNAEVTAFCPNCLQVHYLARGRILLTCCGRRWRIDAGTFLEGKYRCSACGATFGHRELKTVQTPRVLVAVEVTEPNAKRLIRRAEKEDVEAIERAAEDLSDCSNLGIPRSPLPKNQEDGRPQIYGVTSLAGMFSARQLILFARAFDWIGRSECAPPTRRGLALALSNALATNNLFCSYATDYGRLVPLFTIRSYALPILSVELNPLHSDGGRGTISAMLRRVLRSQESVVRRHTWDPKARRVKELNFRAKGQGRIRTATQDGRKPRWRRESFDVVLTDPPYFDYIPYSDLSQFFRAWLEEAKLLRGGGGEPLYPAGESPKEDFSEGLARAFIAMNRALKKGGCIIFTYHSANPEAWEALAASIRRAQLTITAAFPLWADPKSFWHDEDGKCQWDLCFVCRPLSEEWLPASPSLVSWRRQTRSFRIPPADVASWQLAAEMIRNLQKGGHGESG